jgi:S1-C subfamily serine protease
MRHRFVLPGLVFALALTLLPAGPAAEQSRRSLYERTLAGTIMVSRPKDFGTGWIYDRKERLAITNYHVVREEQTVSVHFPQFSKDGRVVAEKKAYTSSKQVKAKVLFVDKVRDLALIQITSIPPRAAQLELAPTLPEPGDRVHSVGNPVRSDARWIYTSGTVRQVYRKTWPVILPHAKDTIKLSARIIEIQSPINGGDSGGPLVNDGGELVAVVQGGARNASLINYAISYPEVKEFVRAYRDGTNRVTASPRKAPSKTASKASERSRTQTAVKRR